jgi:hypothetical protein
MNRKSLDLKIFELKVFTLKLFRIAVTILLTTVMLCACASHSKSPQMRGLVTQKPCLAKIIIA